MATFNQEKVVQEIVKQVRNGKKVSVSKAMRDSGVYAPSTSKIPSKVTSSKSFQELLDKYLPEDLLLKKSKEGLEATTIRFTPGGDKIKVPDFSTRHKYVQTGMQLRGKLKDNGPQGPTINNFLVIGGEQLKRIASRVLDGDTEGETTSGGLSDSNQS